MRCPIIQHKDCDLHQHVCSVCSIHVDTHITILAQHITFKLGLDSKYEIIISMQYHQVAAHLVPWTGEDCLEANLILLHIYTGKVIWMPHHILHVVSVLNIVYMSRFVTILWIFYQTHAMIMIQEEKFSTTAKNTWQSYYDFTVFLEPSTVRNLHPIKHQHNLPLQVRVMNIYLT